MQNEQTKPSKPSLPVKNKKTRWFILLISLIALIILTCVWFFLLSPSLQYNKGLNLLASGEYTSASEVFGQLGSFRDSETLSRVAACDNTATIIHQLIIEEDYSAAFDTYTAAKQEQDFACSDMDTFETEGQYAYAYTLMESSQWTQARQVLETIPPFGNSPVWLATAKTNENYEKANSLLEDSKPEQAVLLLPDIHNHPEYDAIKTKVLDALHNAYLSAVDQSDFELAGSYLDAISPYRDVTEDQKDLTYLHGVALYDAGKYDEAYPLLNSLGVYKTSKALIDGYLYQVLGSWELSKSGGGSVGSQTITFGGDGTLTYQYKEGKDVKTLTAPYRITYSTIYIYEDNEWVKFMSVYLLDDSGLKVSGIKFKSNTETFKSVELETLS